MLETFMNVLKVLAEMSPIALMLGTPLIIAALGGLYSERSGIVNIALEACMLVGAFVTATIVSFLADAGVANPAWFALLGAIISGMLFIVLHAIASIHLKADQTISGTALNVISTGLTIYACEIIFNQKSSKAFSVASSLQTTDFLKDIPIFGKILGALYPTTYIAIILVVITWFIMYKTAFGLRLRSCGEFPQASASMGVNVVKIRWIAVLASGALAGLAGGALLLTTQTYFYSNTVHGLGFVAIATLIFGRWNPWGVLTAGVFFGFAQTIGLYSNSISFLKDVPSQFFSMFPYVITIVVIAIFSGKSAAPKASGEIYDASKR